MPTPNSPDLAGTPRITKRRVETRLRLLGAASELFATKGFGRTTVEEVCDGAGFTRGAFYSNFDSLDELFFALQEQRSETLLKGVGRAVAAAIEEFADTTPSVSGLMERVVGELPLDRRTQLLNLEFTAHALRHPSVATALNDYRAELRRAIGRILETGMRATGRNSGHANLDDLARVILAIHEGLATQELLEPDTSLAALKTRALTWIINPPASTN